MIVHLVKSARQATISYVAHVRHLTDQYACVRAYWSRPAVDLGYMQFAPGDYLDEHFYAHHWYNIFAVYRQDHQLRGWYCNVCRPAEITPQRIVSVDLELDMFVSADLQHIVRLDEDEFAARQYDVSDPEAHQQALQAMSQLEALVRIRQFPFRME